MYGTVRFILILAVGGWLFSACQPGAIPTPADHTVSTRPSVSPTTAARPTAAQNLEPDTEEYAVYAALLEDKYASELIEQVLVVDQTQVNNADLVERDINNFKEVVLLAPELVASFKERNQQPHQIEPNLDLSMEYQLFSQQEIDELQIEDEASGWKLFYELYPNSAGFIYLSRVGFSADLSQALVYYSMFRYKQPIMGGYYFLSREDGRWVIGESYEWMT